MTAATKELTAAEAVAACLADIRTARLAAGEAEAKRARGREALKVAEADKMAGADGAVLGEPGAKERMEDASEREHAARAVIESAGVDAEAAARVLRTAEARLKQMRLTHYDELANHAEESAVGPVAEAAAALVEPLRRYLDAYGAALRVWNPLGPASQARVLEMDREAGEHRDIRAVWHDAEVPPCPLPPDVIQVIQAVQPRPRFRNPGYQPGGTGGVEIIDVVDG